MSTHGTYSDAGGRPVLRFERRLPEPVDRVWQVVSDPAELAGWFPQAISEDELRQGGTVTFSFIGDDGPSDIGRVVELEPGRVLAFTWFGELLRLELEPDAEAGRGTVLRFSQVVEAEPDAAARTMAGWHVCLDVLARRVAGALTSGPSAEPIEVWRAHYEHYVAAGVPSGAPIPRL